MNLRAISFTAFCTVGQIRPESVEHNIRAAKLWCERNGYVLEEYAEPPEGTPELPQGSPCLGGLHLVQYRLGRGLIQPGTALILEALTGVPRVELSKALQLLEELIARGMVVVTLVDNKVWNAQALAGVASFMTSVLSTYSMSSDSWQGSRGKGA